MGIFTKEEKYNKETGKFETTKKGLFNRESRTPVSDKLMEQAKPEHSSSTPVSDRLMRQAPKKESRLSGYFKKAKEKRAYEKQIYDKAYKQAREKAIRRSARTRARRGVDQSMIYSTKNNLNPFGSFFDSGIDYRKKKKGKPVDIDFFGSGKSKKSKKSKKKQSDPFGLGDFFEW